ncbi:putative two-component system response regulator [Paucidesulfovibrio gracilis DSM 16080]|uniref:Putative two-component system response regulator n=1 Tax=Paucidesulfovibrio gracilis DSM 16080 TaxID=1121449 RepID=A0A1T4WM10_9BACT|nr:HD domain-containing phosphohydrolase [Paucidesulfovibrio gracilis]SKA78400.1 putative two-component system response regulator [Paucidesulfovibrio gracilis DSM 16080]
MVNWDLEKANTVLVVEDSRFQRKTLVRQLKGWDFDILEASNGKEGLEQFERHSPKLVITDLEMPVMDGFDVIRSIRKYELNYTYIIVLTALADKENLVKALEVGADDFIIKPVNLEELKVRLGAAERIFRLQSQDKLIFALAQLADCRSEETGNHLRRVKICTRLLCEDLAHNGFDVLTSARIGTIESMSVLHDIGKVAIPDSVLNKPGKYTKLEFRIMKKHTEVGGQLLEDIYQETGSEQLRVAKDIVMHHHEKWDGTGYPHQLKGEEIPLSARIVSLADVFDALGSERCYKPSFSREKCHDIIVSERGRHFDPDVVDAFLRQEDELWVVLQQLRDSFDGCESEEIA